MELLSLKNALLISQHHLTKTAAALLNRKRAFPQGQGLVAPGGRERLIRGLRVLRFVSVAQALVPCIAWGHAICLFVHHGEGSREGKPQRNTKRPCGALLGASPGRSSQCCQHSGTMVPLRWGSGFVRAQTDAPAGARRAEGQDWGSAPPRGARNSAATRSSPTFTKSHSPGALQGKFREQQLPAINTPHAPRQPRLATANNNIIKSKEATKKHAEAVAWSLI